MFNAIKWLDHCVSPNNSFRPVQNADRTVSLIPAGTVIQQGTKMSAKNFNRMEEGILDADLANRLLAIATKNSSENSKTFTYGDTDLIAGSSALETGKLYFVYE